jgi:hypothetical protein
MYLVRNPIANPTAHDIAKDEDMLGILAMQYRRTKNLVERQNIAKQYSATVGRLIQSGIGEEAPPPEDQLPKADMPPVFFEFWSR